MAEKVSSDAANMGEEAYSSQLPPLRELGSTQFPTPRPALQYIRRLLPNTIVVLLGSLMLVIKPVAHLSGDPEYSYLILVIYTIYFTAGGNTVGRQLQVTAIGIAGTCVGIGWSALGIELGSIANRRAGAVGSLYGRLVPAVFFATIAFIGAFVKSRFARLYSGCVLSIFVSIFLLGKGVDRFKLAAEPLLGMLFPVLLAAGTSLTVVLLVWPTTANVQLARKLVDAFGTASELLHASLHLYELDASSAEEQYTDLRTRVATLRDRLCSQILQIQSAYDEASFEIIFSYFPVHRFAPLINSTLQLQTMLVSRTGLHTGHEVSPRPTHGPVYLRKLVDELGSINLACLNALRVSLGDSSRLKGVRILELGKRATQDADKLQQALADCMLEFQDAVAQAIDEALQEMAEAEDMLQSRLFQAHAFRDCFWFTCLLEISQDISLALRKADSIMDHENKRRRIYFPASSSAFVPVRYANHSEGQETEDFADEDSDEDDARSKRYRSTAGMLFNAAALPLSVIRPHVSRRSRYCSLSAMWRFVRFIPRSFQAWLASEKMYARRERLHNLLASARSSRHVQYATKCGLGLVLLSLPGWLPFDSPGYNWHRTSRFPWASVAFLYCLQSTTGATFRDAVLRTCGTIAGGVYAGVGQQIARNNPYGLAAVTVFQSLFTGYIILMKPAYQGFGVVFALTLPTILFSDYLDVDDRGIVKLALLRVQNIEIGILSALILNILIMPYHAKRYFSITCAKAVDRLTKLYLSMSQQVLKRDRTLSEATRKRYEKLENATRLSLSRAAGLSQVVHLEASLLPKPVAQYRKLVQALEKALNLLSGLRAIREHIPRKSVVEVLPERTELVSSILITMHAISHSLHNHLSVPQLLPNPQAALEHLVTAMEEQICTRQAVSLAIASPATAKKPLTAEVGTSSATTLVGSVVKPPFPPKKRRSTHSTDIGAEKLGFRFAFALAENEAILEIIAALTDALNVCKELYGEASIIDQQDVQHVSLHVRSGAGTPTRSGARTPLPRTATMRSASSWKP